MGAIDKAFAQDEATIVALEHLVAKHVVARSEWAAVERALRARLSSAEDHAGRLKLQVDALTRDLGDGMARIVELRFQNKDLQDRLRAAESRASDLGWRVDPGRMGG